MDKNTLALNLRLTGVISKVTLILFSYRQFQWFNGKYILLWMSVNYNFLFILLSSQKKILILKCKRGRDYLDLRREFQTFNGQKLYQIWTDFQNSSLERLLWLISVGQFSPSSAAEYSNSSRPPSTARLPLSSTGISTDCAVHFPTHSSHFAASTVWKCFLTMNKPSIAVT